MTRARTAEARWQRHLSVAAGCGLFGVVVHVFGAFLPVQAEMLGLGIGVVGAAFLLAWAADAGEAVFAGGLVLAGIALLAVLPEFVIELRLAFTQQADLVTANLTGATRLLLTGALVLPLVVAHRGRRGDQAAPTVTLGTNRRLELAILLVTSVFAIQIVIRGNLSVFDGGVFLALYVVYARRVQGTQGERPAVMGVAAGLLSLPPGRQRPAILLMILGAGAAVLTIANPFADALLATGTLLGVDPYLLIQSVVPLATEAAEFVIVAVLVVNHRPAQGLAIFLASSVSQWTLALGAVPLAYMLGGGGPVLPLSGREQLELGFTVTTTLFVVAALLTLRPELPDSYLVASAFVVQLVYPAPIARFGAGFVLLVFAIDLLFARRHAVRPLVRMGVGRQS